MGKAKRLASLVLCLIICISVITSCSSPTTTTPAATASDSAANPTAATASDSTEPVTYKKHLDCILDALKIAVINPLSTAAGTSGNWWVSGMIYENLVRNMGKGEYVPALATSWETTDWKTITFKLRDDVTFSNGEKFTSADVVYTVKAGQAAVGTTAQDAWDGVERVTAIDPYTVEFVLKGVDVDFLYKASGITVGILNEKAINEDNEKGYWVGTGPWMVTEFATNDYVKVARNDNYWGEIPKTETMTFKYIPEESTRLIMMQNGEADVCFAVGVTDLPILEEDTENFTLYKTNLNPIDMLGFNMNDPLCSDLNFRMAVASALNRKDIALVCRGEYADPETTGSFWGTGTEHRKDFPMIPEDLEAAKRYLAASSYKGETVELSAPIATPGKACETIQQQLAQIGIKIEIKTLDLAAFTVYNSNKDNKTQLFTNVSTFTSSASSARSVFYSGASGNRASYNNPEVDRLLDLAPTLVSLPERQQAYYDVQAQIAKDIPYISLWYITTVVSCAKGVDGLVLSPDSLHDLRYMYRAIG